MSGKADSTSIRFLICHLQSRMYQRPRRTPANWPEMKAGVDPTEEKGAPHPFLPSRGDLCLLFSTQAPKLLVLLFECTPLPFLCPSQRWKVGRTEAEVGLCAFGGGRGSGKVHLAVCVVYILELLLASAASCPGLAAGIDKLLLQVGRDELHPSCQPHRVRRSRLVCYRL